MSVALCNSLVWVLSRIPRTGNRWGRGSEIAKERQTAEKGLAKLQNENALDVTLLWSQNFPAGKRNF